MGFSLMMETMAVTGPPRHGKMHYMGLNLELFWQTGHNMNLILARSNRTVLRAFFWEHMTVYPHTTAIKTGFFPEPEIDNRHGLPLKKKTQEVKDFAPNQ